VLGKRDRGEFGEILGHMYMARQGFYAKARKGFGTDYATYRTAASNRKGITLVGYDSCLNI
jgi:hypothetical protein